MKKVLLAFDGSDFSDGAFEFVRRLNAIQPVLVTGVFMPQADHNELWSYAAAAGAGAVFTPVIETAQESMIEKKIEKFISLCISNGIQYRVHEDYSDFVLTELKRESRFADVMVLSGELFYKGVMASVQFDYLRDILHAAECPVIVVPENYAFPEENILAYDGSEESVYAIKQFSYVFPELAKHPTLLVYVDDEEKKDFPSRTNIMELVTQHYADLTFFKLEVRPKHYFTTWASDKKNAILISGSFSRSILSQLLRKSFVEDVLREKQIPVFIAHK